jgi:hypothetical protein
LCLLREKHFLQPEKVFVLHTLWLTLNCIPNKIFVMKNQLPTQSALVSINPCKSHDFLYVIKKVNSDTWLPRIPKSVVKDIIQSKGLYNILYRTYTNKAGYESIFISAAQKIVTS